MKKTASVLIMLAALLLMTTGTAQVQLGLQAGTNLGSIKMDPKQEGLELGTRTGFLFGGVLFYSFSPMLGLQVEPAYVQKGATADISTTVFLDISGTVSEYPAKIEATLTGDYIDIPVLLKASFGDGPVKPYLLAGASLAFLLGDTELEMDKVTATINGQDEDITSEIPSDDRTEKVETKSTDFILNFGAGVLIPLGQVNIFIEGQYNLGLSDVNDEPPVTGEVQPTIKTTGIQIKAGVMFPLK